MRIYIFIIIFGIAAAFLFIAAESAYACDSCGGRTVGAEWCEGTTRKGCVANDGTRFCTSNNSACSGCDCTGPCVPDGGGYRCSEPDPTCPYIDPSGTPRNQHTIDIGTCASPSTATVSGNVSCNAGGSYLTANLQDIRVFTIDSTGSVRGQSVTNASGNFTISNFGLSGTAQHYAVRSRASGNSHDPLFQQVGGNGSGCAPPHDNCLFSVIAGQNWPNFNFRSNPPQNLAVACNAGASTTYTWQHVANAQSYILRIDYDEQPNVWNPQPIATGGSPGDMWLGLAASSYCNLSTNICSYVHNASSPKPFVPGTYYGFSVQARGFGDMAACRREYGSNQGVGGHQSYTCVPTSTPTPPPPPAPTCSVTLTPNGPVNVNAGGNTTLTGRVTTAGPAGVIIDRIRFVSANTSLLPCSPTQVSSPGLNVNRNTVCTASTTTVGVTTVRAYADVRIGTQTATCASSQVTVNVNPTCTISLPSSPWTSQVGYPAETVTATVNKTPITSATAVTVTFSENDPSNAFSCTPLTDSSLPYQTTCTPQGVGSGSLTASATVSNNGRPGSCGPVSMTVNISPLPTPTPTPSVGPIQLKGSFVAGDGYEFTRQVAVSGTNPPLTFEYDPKYLVDFVNLIGEALLDWIEVR